VIASIIDDVTSRFRPIGWLLVVIGLILTFWARYASRQSHS
jgi:ABC-type transport system involved in cytochrome c biogenesis permease subunit